MNKFNYNNKFKIIYLIILKNATIKSRNDTKDNIQKVFDDFNLIGKLNYSTFEYTQYPYFVKINTVTSQFEMITIKHDIMSLRVHSNQLEDLSKYLNNNFYIKLNKLMNE